MAANQALTAAIAPAPAQVIETNASEKVAMREDVWRLRKWLRLDWERNQSWMAVEDAAAAALPRATTMAWRTEINASRPANGRITTPTHCITTSIFARRRRGSVNGADSTRSGASAPEIVSQASPPASCPADMIRTGTRTIEGMALRPRLPQSSIAGGIK